MELKNIQHDYDELSELVVNAANEMQLVGKMKELVPEFISNNSIFESLDPKIQTKIMDMVGAGVRSF